MHRTFQRGGLVSLAFVAASLVGLSNYPAARSGVEAEELAAAPVVAAEIESRAKGDDVKPSDAKSGDVKNGDTKSGDAEPRKNGKGRGPLPTFTPEREAAALTFVAAHHDELTPLLNHLKKSRPNEYQKAIRKLFNDSERLAHNRETHPQRYELELQEWKLTSRIELLVARLSMDRSPALEAELRKALAEQFEVRRGLLEMERERVLQRAKVLEKEIAELDAKRDEKVDDWLEKAVNAAGKKKGS
jgi:hypothetical protein